MHAASIYRDGRSAPDIEQIQDEPNVCNLLDADECDRIGKRVIEAYEQDRRSRESWEKDAKEWIDLALQVKKDKSFPWPGASNVKFPLLTIASLQFASRAYPALVRPPSLVRHRVVGDDESGQKRKRAQRVSEHMSYQLLEEDEKWEDNHDRLLAVLPISGIAYKKSYFDKHAGHNKSELILPHELVVNYWATSMENAQTVTHVYRLSTREIIERQRQGIFRETEVTQIYSAERPDPLMAADREGREPDQHSDQHQMLEQHCWMDLDDDGLEEPYIVTVDYSTQKTVRIQNRFQAVLSDGQRIVQVEPIQYFTRYEFLPAPDGSFYGLGFGRLLGPINESTNSLINQLIDAGTLQNGSRGFLARGARIQGGQIRFKHPFEWLKVNVAGGTLKDSIVPLPVNQPSAVLFQLLGLLVQYGERISSVSDMMVGENPGQNTPAYTSQKMIEQGMQVFTGIFKRVFRCMRDEYRKLYVLNREYLSPESYYAVIDGPEQQIFQSDYQGNPNDIAPAADPNQALREQRVTMASMVLERSMAVPGYDKAQVEREWLEAIEHPNADKIFPLDEQGQPKIKPSPDPEIEVKVAEEQRRMLEGKQRGEVQMIEAQTKAMVGEAQILELQTRAQLNLAKAKAEGDTTAIKLYEAQLKEVEQRRQALEKLMDDATERYKIEQQPKNTPAGD